MPPSEVEGMLLGAMFCDPSLLDGDRVREELFTNFEAITIFKSMRSLRESGRPVTLLTVKDILGARVKGSFLSNLTSMATAANAEYYIEQLKESWRKRVLGRIVCQVQDMNGTKSEDVIRMVEEEIVKLRSNGDDLSEVDPNKTVHDIIDLAEKRRKADGPMGIMTGFNSLDRMLGGFQPSCLYLIASRTSVGKTSLALSMIDEQLRKGVKVAMASLEMSGQQIFERLLSARADVSSSRLRYGNLSDEDFTSLIVSAGPLASDPFLLLDRPNLSLGSLRSWAHGVVGKGSRVLYVDYVGLLSTDGDRPRWERMAEVSGGLKSLARELRLPVVALIQVNRTAAEDGGDPGLHHLRDSGSFEQDADVVILLVRSEIKDGDPEVIPGKMIVAKNRQGPTGRIELSFKRSVCRFREAVK